VNSRPAPISWADLAAALALALLVLPTRLPVAGDYLGTWDSVQYALAMEQFDVALHQPHPPGYILLVGLLRAVNLALGDARLSILALNTFFGALAVGLTYLLGRLLFSRLAGLVAAMLLLTSPTMWYCGATYEPYVVLAGLGALVAYLGYRAIAGEHRLMAAATVALALSGGVRPDAALFLAPLWLLSLICVLYSRQGGRARYAAGHLVLLATVSLAWYLPLLQLSGGYKAYMLLSRAQLGHCFAAHSALFGAPWRDQATMALRHGANAVLALGPIAVALLLVGLPHLARDQGRGPVARLFLIAWLLPAAAFYTLIFFSKPGYVLIYVPALALLAGRSFDLLEATTMRRAGGQAASTGGALALAAAIALNGMLFLAGPSPAEVRDAPLQAGKAGRLLRLLRAEAASVTRAAISQEDKRTATYLGALREFSPKRVAIVCRSSSPDWRQLMYYLRDRDVYWLVDDRLMRRTPNRSEFWLAHGGRVTLSSTGAGFWLPGKSSERLPVPLAPGIEELLILASADDPFLLDLAPHLARLEVGDGCQLLRYHLKKGAELATDRFLFTRKNSVVTPAGQSSPQAEGGSKAGAGPQTVAAPEPRGAKPQMSRGPLPGRLFDIPRHPPPK
jgi:hypothetical protein